MGMVHAKVYTQQDVFTRLTQPQPCFEEGEDQYNEEQARGASPERKGESTSCDPLRSSGDRGVEDGDSRFLNFLRRQNAREEERDRRLKEIENAIAPTFQPKLDDQSRKLVRRSFEQRQSAIDDLHDADAFSGFQRASSIEKEEPLMGPQFPF